MNEWQQTDHNGICVKYFFRLRSMRQQQSLGSTTVAQGPFMMFSILYPVPNSLIQSTIPIWNRLPSRQQSSEFSISTTRIKEQSMMRLAARYLRVGSRYWRTLSLQKMGQLWRSMRQLMSRGMIGGLEKRRVTEPLKSQRYHSLIPKKRFSMAMQQSDDMLRLIMKAPQMGVRMLPECRWVKYSDSDLLKVINSLLGIFLITSRSLQDRMKDEPDLPPVAIQWSAPPMEEMNRSREILFFLLSISNQLGSMMMISKETDWSRLILLAMSNILYCDSISECIFLYSQFSSIGQSFYMQQLAFITNSFLNDCVCSRHSLWNLLLRPAAIRV